MSAPLQVVVLLLALLCFLLAAAGVTTVRRPVALGWLGLALVTTVPLWAAIEAL